MLPSSFSLLIFLFFLFARTDFGIYPPDTVQSEELPLNVPEQNYQPEKLPLDQLTHIIFSFSNVIDGEMKFRNEETGEKLRLLGEQKQNYLQLKVMLACGGWGAGRFSDMKDEPNLCKVRK